MPNCLEQIINRHWRQLKNSIFTANLLHLSTSTFFLDWWFVSHEKQTKNIVLRKSDLIQQPGFARITLSNLKVLSFGCIHVECLKCIILICFLFVPFTGAYTCRPFIFWYAFLRSFMGLPSILHCFLIAAHPINDQDLKLTVNEIIHFFFAPELQLSAILLSRLHQGNRFLLIPQYFV